MPVLKAEGKTFPDAHAGAGHRRRRLRHHRRARGEGARRGGGDPRARRQALGQHLAVGRADPGGGHQAAARGGAARRHARAPLPGHPRQVARRMRPRDRAPDRRRVGENRRVAGRAPQVPLSCVLDFQYPGHSRPHMHASPSLFGAELHAALLAAVERHEIPLATSAHATDLYADADGRVRGVRVTRPDGKTEDIGCDALILACNGYGGNKEMLDEVHPRRGRSVLRRARRQPGRRGALGRGAGRLDQGHGLVPGPRRDGHAARRAPRLGHGHRGRLPRQRERQALLERERRLLRAGAEGRSASPATSPGRSGTSAADAIAMQQASHKEAKDAGAIKRCDSVEAIARVVGCDAEGAGADLRRRRGRAARREEGRVRPRLHAQAAAQAAVLRVEDRGRAHPHPGRARGEHGDARAAQGRHAAAEPLRRRRRRARPVGAGGLGLPFRLRPDDRDQHGPPRRQRRRRG